SHKNSFKEITSLLSYLCVLCVSVCIGVFAVQSSEIDWCENKFQYSENVAEFYDTISNSSFFISAPITMYLAHPYAREKSGAVHLVWIMLMLIECCRWSNPQLTHMF
uniref:Alkaline ceramidase n=1 Tax=Callorhinchus milii TaxID=7868 RepID=A0A4W3JGK3_CALMI